MRRRLALGLLALLLLTGCRSTPAAPAQPLTVAATVFPLYDFAKAIGGDRCQVVMLLTPGAEAHGYDPALSDLAAVRHSDLLLHTGGESDAWALQILASLGLDLPMLDASAWVDRLPEEEEPAALHGEHDPEWDEHIWTSPKNAMKIAQGICDALCAADPAGEAVYRRNAQAYQNALSQLDADYTAAIAAAPHRTLLFADRFPFAYLAHDYGLTCYHALPGCSAVTEPGLPAVAELIRVLRRDRLPAVLYLEFSDGRTARTVAQATGAATLRIHSCHNVTRQEWADGATYLTLMRQNLAVIEEALGAETPAHAAAMTVDGGMTDAIVVH